MEEKKNTQDIKIAIITQQIKLLDFKIGNIKDNHLKHLQDKIDLIYKVLFFLGAGIVSQLFIAIRTSLTG